MTAKVKFIDLAQFDAAKHCSKGFEVELVHPASGRGLGAFVTVLGSESPEYLNFVRKEITPGKGKRQEKTIEDAESWACVLLAEVTVGWREVGMDGAELPFSKQAATKLYQDQRWIRSQVDKAVHDLGNFMPD